MQIVILRRQHGEKSILIDSVGALPCEGVRVGWFRTDKLGRHYAELMCRHKKKPAAVG